MRGDQGEWRSVSFDVDESYMAFPLEAGDDAVAVVLLPKKKLPWGYVAVPIAVIAAGTAWGIRRKRKSFRVEETETEDSQQM